MRRLIYVILIFSVLEFVECQKISAEKNVGGFIFNPASEYMAVFGDIQYYTFYDNKVGLYQHSLDWIYRKYEEGVTFNCILHTGDLAEKNEEEQWNRFYTSIDFISSMIPCYSMIGDHDYTWDSGHILDRSSTHFNDYVKFPLSTQKVVAWFEEGRMENIVVENTLYGERLDFLILEFGPRREVVEWADAYVKAHPDHRFILMNHEYLEMGGGRRTTNLKCAFRLRWNTTYTTPEQLWENLIKCNDNIRLVLCGHVGGLYALTIDTNDFGRDIPQIMHNIQSKDYRFDNWLMLWEFPAESDSANVCIYNTKTGQYYNDQQCLFRFKYRDFTPASIVGSVSHFSTKRLLYNINGLPADENSRGIRIIKDGKKTVKVAYKLSQRKK